MSGKLDGRIALVTGAARGQGEAHARRFVAEGAKVVIGDVLDDLGAAVAADLGDAALYVHLDVTSEADWQAAVKTTTDHFGGLHVLVNNAGISPITPLLSTSTDDFMRVIEINLLGNFLGIRTAAPAIIESGAGGSIVNVSSVNGMFGGATNCAYVSSKFAVRGLTKSAALDLGKHGIRVNSIHPGIIDTEMAREGLREVPDGFNPAAKLPLGRFGTSEEAASLALFLASEESSYCTGSEFTFDGGWTTGVSL